jgi:hypothetical protein
MNQVQSHKNKWDPPLFKYFYLVRIAMLMLICIDYFHIIPDTAWWKIPVIARSEKEVCIAKLHLRDRTQAAIYAVRHGITKFEP